MTFIYSINLHYSTGAGQTMQKNEYNDIWEINLYSYFSFSNL